MDHIERTHLSKKRRTNIRNDYSNVVDESDQFSSSKRSISSRASRFSTYSRQQQQQDTACNNSSKIGQRTQNRRNLKSSDAEGTISSSPHIICAIGENLARETCVVSLDLSAPFFLNATKQSNGQSYSETIAYLSILCPNEVLMNEGRYHSPLARKVVQHFDIRKKQNEEAQSLGPSGNPSTNAVAGPCEDEDTVVKFISRAYFDQTKGAHLLRKLARQDTYDSTMVEEYILLSSSHAVLHYTQLTLGAVTFTKNCLDVRVSTGGHNNHRMEIDRSTIQQLELLTNNSKPNYLEGTKSRSSSTKSSLLSTIDCTKTSVGHRLLRTTIMAPPCRIDTITARLDLVETFLYNQEFFYATLHQLQNLSSLDHMLKNVVVVPKRAPKSCFIDKRGLGVSSVAATTPSLQNPGRIAGPAIRKANAADARIASKGISSLVCIKSTLAAIPVLASILKNHLDNITESDSNRKENCNEIKEVTHEEYSMATAKTSLLVGLGLGNGHASSAENRSRSLLNHQLLRAIIFALRQPELDLIRRTIEDAFTESTSYSRNANAMKHQECFALKSSDDTGFMDILRKTFLSNVDDIYQKADEYAEVHDISHVTVKHSATRGYYLSLPLERASDLPNIFLQPSKSGRFIHCTTEEVQSLNDRAQQNVWDLLVMTRNRIDDLLDIARSNYDALARLSDAIALLDLCHSFADNVLLSNLPWARPKLTEGIATATEEGASSHQNHRDESYAIAISNGRYAIDVESNFLPSNDGPGQWIANDTYTPSSKNLTIVTGINGSGKTTYLKQIAIIVLLAHCGSFVPAEKAMIPLTHRLCARMMTTDDQENNMSSFMLEMKETAFICNNANSRSLILLDEIGRATGNEDGVAIAWAVAEALLVKGALTYFVTHYPQLTQMSRVYPGVQNQHLKAYMPNNDNGGIQYTHKLQAGPCDAASNYGVEMASECGWPSDVIEEARRIEGFVKEKLVQTPLCDETCDIDKEIEYRKVMKDTIRKLVDCVTSDCEPNVSSLRSALQNIKISLLEKVPESAIVSLLDADTNNLSGMSQSSA